MVTLQCARQARKKNIHCNIWLFLTALKRWYLKQLIFKASALWADTFYKSIYPYVCVFVCLSVHF